MPDLNNIIQVLLIRIHQINLSNPLNLVDLVLAATLVISFLAYIRKFPVFRVFLGILLLVICSGIFFMAGFTLTGLLFGVASNLILLSLPLIFAPEIRHYLEKLGRFPFIRWPFLVDQQGKKRFIRRLVAASFGLVEQKVGGTIVIARRTGLGQTIETGTRINGRFSAKLISNLFFPKSPLHDGAVVAKDNQIIAAGCLLPIHSGVKLDAPFGTRHKAGLSITKDTDAVVILISEQRGEVSLAENGKLAVNLSQEDLVKQLNKLL